MKFQIPRLMGFKVGIFRISPIGDSSDVTTLFLPEKKIEKQTDKPDHTAHKSRCSLIRVCIVCPNLLSGGQDYKSICPIACLQALE